MAFLSVNEYLNRRAAPFRIRIEVLKDDGVSWLDLSDRISYDRLMGLPGLTTRQTRTVGAAEVNANSVAVDNGDRFWDGAPPTGITTWHRRTLRVSLVAPPAPVALATVLIEDVETSSDNDQATLRLIGLAKRLIDKQADRVKNGRDWYTNRSIGWLVRQLLAQEFNIAEVESWSDVLTRYQIPLADPTERAVSAYGRPPEFDGTTWRQDGTTLYGCPYAVVNTSGTHYGKHWVGIGGELWRWDPDTDIWTKWAAMPVGKANFKIFHIYVNAARGKVICVGWEVDAPPSTHPRVNANRSGAKNGIVDVFVDSMTTQPATLTPASSTPLNIYTGHYFVRAGNTVGTTVSIGAPSSAAADAVCYGVNIPVPFGHYMLTRYSSNTGTPPLNVEVTHKTTATGKVDAAEQGAGVLANVTHAIDSPGYYAPFYVLAGGALPLDYRWSVGQSRGAFAHQNLGDDFVCTVISWDAGLAQYRFRLWKLNTNSLTWTDTGLYVMADASGTLASQNYQPTSFQFRSDDARLLVSGTYWKETAWTGGAPVQTGPNEPFGSVVAEWTYPLTDSASPAGRPVTSFVNLNTAYAVGSFPSKFWALNFDAIYGASDYILTSGIDVRNVLSGLTYFTVPIRLSTIGYGDYLYSNGRLSGAVYEASSGKWFVHDGGSNQVRSIVGNSVVTATTDWAFEDSGFQPVSGDTQLLMGLVVDKKRGSIFGVSGPGSGAQCNAEVMNNGPLSGKYYLWQLAGWLTDRVELADFSNDGRRGTTAMPVWDALEELAAMMDGVFGFDGDGAFYFKARPGATTPVATLTTRAMDGVSIVPDCTVRKSRGSRKVFNLVEMTPSITVLSPPTGAVRVLARPLTFDRDPWNASPEVFQGNNRNQNILLRCVEGGTPGNEDAGLVRKSLVSARTLVDYSPGGTERIHRLRFAFLMYDALIETQLTAAVIPLDKIRVPLEAAKDVRGVETGIADVQARSETDEVNIADTEQYTVRTRTDMPEIGQCELRLDRTITTAWEAGTKLTIRTRGSNRWSDSSEGVTSGNLVVGAAAAGAIETLTVFSTRNLAAGMILRVEEDGIEDMRILQVLNETQVSVRRGCGGTPGGNHIGVAPFKAYWAPIESADFPAGYRFEIGGTGVSLRFVDLPPAGENPFMVGDAIEIVCPGLSLESQQQATIIAYNVGSIQRLGGQKIPWPTARQSRFAGHRQCVEIARRVARDYGDEHYDLEVAFPMRWIPKINETYLVEDPRGTLPTDAIHSPNGDFPPISPDTAYVIGVLVEGVTLDPLSDRVSVETRAINPHV